MAKDRRKLQHIHSSIADKQPTPQSLEVGEIAVNNAANQEFLSIKNSENKVKRFSSDEQIITWMEKKEVMPYEGYTRGSDGPAGATGPDSVTNDDLLQNKSNLIIKLNQVAATNTVKHDKVNGAKDIYGNCVNPTSDSGVTDGAGFAIDMSRYAMIGANPSFSSLTVTDKTDLSGNTTIADGDGTSTRSGHTLTIKTTDVVANDTNWTETITNKQSTVTNETDKITTLNESATTRNTTVGTETLHVSGTTTETHDKDVTITNNSGVTETTKGNVVENVSGTTTINHSGDTTTNESGNTVFNTNGNTTFMTSGNTVIHSDGAVGITAVDGIVAISSESSIIITANDDLCETAGDVAAFKGANTTNIGSDCTNANQTKTLNVRANSADTRVTSAYTSATTATTIIGTSNASATTATLSGNTLVVNEATSISAKTPSTTISGTNFTLNETNTTINSCGKVEITTDSYSLKQCSASGGSAEFEFCNGYTVKSNKISLQQCGSAGTISILAQTQNIDGGNLTINESGDTAINTTGTTNVKSTGNTNIETNGANNKVTIQASGSGGDVEVFANDTLNETGGTVNVISINNTNISAKDFCVKGSTSASIGAPTTNIGKACDNSTATTINISGTTINEGGTTNNNNFTTINNKANFNITGATYISGNTTISGDTTIGGKLYIKPDCTTITSTTVNAGLCEVLNRSTITIEKNTDPSDPQLATVYTIKQNDAVIDTIEVAKDQFLKNAEVVKNTSGEWVIRLTWWIYDPDSGTHTTATTDVNASELVKDLTAVNPTDNGTAANHNVKVSSWYDSTDGDMKFSAETTPNIHVTNMYASNTVSGATVSGTTVKGATVSAGTLTATGNTTLAATTASSVSATSVSSPTISGTNITASAAMRANNVSANTISATTFTGAMSKKLTWAAGAFTADTTGYNGSADKTINVPTAISHLSTRGKLTVTHNGLSEQYDPATDKSMTLPHSALTWQYGSVTDASNGSYDTSAGKTVTIPKNLKHLVNDLSNLTVNFGTATGQTTAATYNGSAATSITIPTSTAHLTKSALTIGYGNIYTGTKDTSYNTEAAKTITIPDSLSNVSNGNAVDSSPTNTSGKITIKKNLEVSGTVTASGAIYSSDRNLKDNIEYVDMDDLSKARNIFFRSFNFKDDETKRKTYGVIAQEIIDAGLSELVHVKDDGMLGVDYISLLTLKLASLEYINTTYGERIEELENKIKELESKIQ